jgi:parallel beta-helix repeat protein
MKTGIVANLNVDARITNNYVGVSSNENNLAPNSIQVGFGASAIVQNNNVHGSQWRGDSNYASAGILFYEAGSVEVNDNTLNYNPLEGNAEIGFYILNTDNSRFFRNILFDNGEDVRHPDEGGVLYDIGIYADCDSTGNVFAANQVNGFNTPTDICYTGPSRTPSATSMTTLSRGVETNVVEVTPVPQPFI